MGSSEVIVGQGKGRVRAESKALVSNREIIPIPSGDGRANECHLPFV